MARKIRADMTVKAMSPAGYAKQEARWKAESDLETLMSAARIRNDKTRLKNALAVAKEKKADLSEVADEDGDDD